MERFSTNFVCILFYFITHWSAHPSCRDGSREFPKFEYMLIRIPNTWRPVGSTRYRYRYIRRLLQMSICSFVGIWPPGLGHLEALWLQRQLRHWGGLWAGRPWHAHTSRGHQIWCLPQVNRFKTGLSAFWRSQSELYRNFFSVNPYKSSKFADTGDEGQGGRAG